jgi:hypothetical protein
MFPSNVLTLDSINEVIDKFFLISKPNKTEKGFANIHMTVKPVTLCEHLLRLSVFSKKGNNTRPIFRQWDYTGCSEEFGFKLYRYRKKSRVCGNSYK